MLSPEIDITARLSSVQFESALLKSQHQEIYLRHKSHALLYFACAQSVYFLNCLNDLRENRLLILNPNDKKLSNKLLKDLNIREPLLIGIVGYGRLGSSLAHYFIKSKSIVPEELKISCRRPECAYSLSSAGVSVCYDNEAVASSVHVLFLCCSPGAVPTISDELKGKISPRTVIYSYVSGYNVQKLRQLFDHEAILCPNYRCNNAKYKDWSPNGDIDELLALPQVTDLTCPVVVNERDTFITTHPKLFTTWLFTAVNFCTFRGHTIEESLKIIDHLFFKNAIRQKKPMEKEDEEVQKEPLIVAPMLIMDDLVRGLDESDKYFPIFDIGDISQRITFLDQRLDDDLELRSVISNYYSQMMQNLYYKMRF